MSHCNFHGVNFNFFHFFLLNFIHLGVDWEQRVNAKEKEMNRIKIHGVKYVYSK